MKSKTPLMVGSALLVTGLALPLVMGDKKNGVGTSFGGFTRTAPTIGNDAPFSFSLPTLTETSEPFDWNSLLDQYKTSDVPTKKEATLYDYTTSNGSDIKILDVPYANSPSENITLSNSLPTWLNSSGEREAGVLTIMSDTPLNSGGSSDGLSSGDSLSKKQTSAPQIGDTLTRSNGSSSSGSSSKKSSSSKGLTAPKTGSTFAQNLARSRKHIASGGSRYSWGR